MSKSNFIKISKEDYKIYRNKATQAFTTMELAFGSQLWTAAAREAVFACINSADALLAKYAGVRNISKNHMDIVDIISNGKYIQLESAKNQANRLRKIISQKNLVDYENKEFTSKKAEEITSNAKRFYSWAHSYLE